MKLKNSTTFENHFLRRMVAWCAKQVEYPVSKVREAQFRNRTRRSYSGHAYGSRRIVCSIGPASRFPLLPDSRPGMSNEIVADREEALIAVTAHELTHLHQYLFRRDTGKKRWSELDARWHEVKALREFRANRDALLAEWSKAPAAKVAKPKPSIVEKRAAKAAADLARWNKKLKLAQTKVRKLKTRVRYYERNQSIAACRQGSA